MSKSAREMRKLKQWLGVPLPEVEAEDTEPEEKEERYPRFYEGRRYMIVDWDETSTFMNVVTGTGCVYRYVGKSGIHYCFREEGEKWEWTELVTLRNTTAS